MLKEVNIKIESDRNTAITFWKLNLRNKLINKFSYYKDYQIENRKLDLVSKSYYSNKSK